MVSNISFSTVTVSNRARGKLFLILLIKLSEFLNNREKEKPLEINLKSVFRLFWIDSSSNLVALSAHWSDQLDQSFPRIKSEFKYQKVFWKRLK